MVEALGGSGRCGRGGDVVRELKGHVCAERGIDGRKDKQIKDGWTNKETG